MTEKEKKVLLEVQDTAFILMQEMDRICRKNNIRYSLTGGTLLGAIRHQDFIPWDDDVDIDFRRNDYDRFIEACKTDLGEDFEFINYDEFGNYFCDFIPRIYYKKCDVKNNFTVEDGKSSLAHDPRMNRIFLEIYRLEDTKGGAFTSLQILLTKMIYGMGIGHRYKDHPKTTYSVLQKVQVKVLSAVGKLFPMKTIFKWYRGVGNMVATGKGAYYYKPSVPIPVEERNVIKKEYYREVVDVPVRGHMFMAPIEYEKVLECLYGDWKSLPPEDQRKPGHFNLSAVKIWK